MDRRETGDTGRTKTLIRDPRFLGLAMMEFWERFAMSGVKSLLVLILVDHIFGGDVSRPFGAVGLRDVFERWFGALSTTGLASQVYGYAGALLYLSIPLGGLVGDLFANRRAVIYSGAALMFVALMAMLRVPTFLPGLAVFMVGTGILKGNLSTQVGQLFATEAERQRGYVVYLGFFNAGAICGPLVCGALAVMAGWPYAIAAAALAVLIGVVGFAATAANAAHKAGRLRHDIPDLITPSVSGLRSTMILMVAILSIYCCWAAYEQFEDIFLLWARARIELHVAGWAIPVAWFVSLDGLVTLLLILGMQALFPWLARRGIALGAQDNILLGGAFCASGYLVLALGSTVPGGAPLSIGWALVYLLLIDISNVLVWPSGLSLITEVAPPRFVGFWMGLFYLHGFFASLWVGISGSYYGRMSDTSFWLLQASVAGLGVGLALAAAVLRRRTGLVQATTTSA